MSDKTRIIQNSLIVGVVGFGALYLIAKYRKSILDQLIRIVNNGRNNMKKQIFVLNTAQECNNFVLKIKESCSAYNVVGFDAEWTMVCLFNSFSGVTQTRFFHCNKSPLIGDFSKTFSSNLIAVV